MRIFVLAFMMAACNNLANPFGSSGDETSTETVSTKSTAPKPVIVDAVGAVIGTLESKNADLTQDFTVRLEDGTRVVLNSSSPTIVLSEGTPVQVAFTNPFCHAEGLDGAIVETRAKTFPLTIDGQSRLYQAGSETTGTIESFLIRIVHSLPDLTCREQPVTADPIIKTGYRLVPYEAPFAYPFNIPFKIQEEAAAP